MAFRVARMPQRICREEEALFGRAPRPRHEAASWRRRPGRHTKHTIGLVVKFIADSVMLNTLITLFTPLRASASAAVHELCSGALLRVLDLLV